MVWCSCAYHQTRTLVPKRKPDPFGLPLDLEFPFPLFSGFKYITPFISRNRPYAHSAFQRLFVILSFNISSFRIRAPTPFSFSHILAWHFWETLTQNVQHLFTDCQIAKYQMSLFPAMSHEMNHMCCNTLVHFDYQKEHSGKCRERY